MLTMLPTAKFTSLNLCSPLEVSGSTTSCTMHLLKRQGSGESTHIQAITMASQRPKNQAAEVCYLNNSAEPKTWSGKLPRFNCKLWTHTWPVQKM